MAMNEGVGAARSTVLGMVPTVLLATAIAGTASLLGMLYLVHATGATLGFYLRYSASIAVPPAIGWGAAGTVLGAALHVAFTAALAALYWRLAVRWPALTVRPVLWGVLYGAALFAIVSFVLMPLRFGTIATTPRGMLAQAIVHVLLVGLPIAIAIAYGRRRKRG